MRLRVPAAVRVAAAGALVLLGLQIPLTAPAQAAATGPFSCVPKFYQASASGGGGFYEYNAASNSLSRVGTGAVSGINGIGYRTADNYIYGVSGTKLYRIDAYGNFSAGTTITGTTPATTGGDFYGGKLVTAPSSSNGFTAIDVDTATATAYPMTAAANGQAAGATWGASDLTVQGDVAYGLNGGTLYIARMDTKQVSSRAVNGTTPGAYGAAYSDNSGNAFFYNNSDNKVFMFTAAELAKATTTASAPNAVLVGGAAATPALTAPNDGASCPDAVSPYVPGVDDGSTTALVSGDAATLSGSVNPNNTTTTVHFCFGTDPALVGCDTVAATPGTLTGNTPQAFTGEVTDLQPGTTYYYRVVATNTVGDNEGEIRSFTTGGGAPATIAQTITFPALSGMAVGDAGQALGASASSGLSVSYSSLSPSVCTVASGMVTAVLPGTCEVAADQAGDATYDPAARVTRTFAVAKAAQTITFPALSGMAVGDAGQALAASASSGLSVSYSSLSPSVCTVASGMVTAVLPGTCEVAADQAGDGTRDAATRVTRTFTVAASGQTITFAPMADVVFGASVGDAVASASSGLPVTVTSTTPQVCSVHADGSHVVALMAGTCQLVASQAGDATRSAATPVTMSFAVAKAAQTVHLSPVADLKVDRGPAHVGVTTSRDVAADLVSTTPLVCTVGARGAINLVAAGTCTVTATVAADESHTSATDAVSFHVLPALVVTEPTPVAAPSGSRLDIAVPATGGVGPYRWAVTAKAGNSLPVGLALDPGTGRLTGTPAKPGDYTVLITVTDSEGEEVVRAVRFTVASNLTGAAPSGRRTVVAGGTLRLPDLSDDLVTWSYQLPPSLHRVRAADGELVLRATTTGRHEVPLTVTDGVGTQTGGFTVTVLPRRVEGGGYRLADGLVTDVAWTSAPGTDGYRVYVDGRLVGRTTTDHLSLGRPLGPASTVTVRAEGPDGLLSEPRRLRYDGARTRAADAPVGAVVHFGTDLADLDRGDRRVLRELARVVRTGGFGHVRVTGYTDARGTDSHNQGLSEDRARAVRSFLGGRLAGLDLRWQGRAAQAPAASNATPEGMALNRRVEIRVW